MLFCPAMYVHYIHSLFLNTEKKEFYLPFHHWLRLIIPSLFLAFVTPDLLRKRSNEHLCRISITAKRVPHRTAIVLCDFTIVTMDVITSTLHSCLQTDQILFACTRRSESCVVTHWHWLSYCTRMQLCWGRISQFNPSDFSEGQT